jgi:sugar phosphate isomerase/epimerase
MKTRLYVPAMYFRNLLGSHEMSPDQWLELAKEKPAGLTAMELVVDQSFFEEYTSRMEELVEEINKAGISVPIVRISAVNWFLQDSDQVWDHTKRLLAAIEAHLGPDTIIQPELVSSIQAFELRNNTTMDPNKIPAGYKYSKYAKVVTDVIENMSKLCEETGIKLVIEPRAGDVLSNPDSVLRFVENPDTHSNFKVVFDVSHMEFQAIATCDAWDQLKESTAVVHISDSDVVSSHHVQVGAGSVPWKTIMGYAARTDDVSLLGVEMFSKSEEPEEVKKEYVEDANVVFRMISRFKLKDYFE